MEIFEKTVGKTGIPRDFEQFDEGEFSLKRQKGRLMELANAKSPKQYQVAYKDFIFGIIKVEDAEKRGMTPVALCSLLFSGLAKFAQVQGKPMLGTYRVGNRLWYTLDFFSQAKEKRMGNAVFVANLCSAEGNKLVGITFNWDASVFSLSRGYVDEVLGSFSAKMRKDSLKEGGGAIIGAITVSQPPKSSSIGELLFEVGNMGKAELDVVFSNVLLLDGNPVFTSRGVDSEPPALLAPGEIRAVRIPVNSPEFPEGNYEFVVSAGERGGKKLAESRIALSFSKPS